MLCYDKLEMFVFDQSFPYDHLESPPSRDEKLHSNALIQSNLIKESFISIFNEEVWKNTRISCKNKVTCEKASTFWC